LTKARKILLDLTEAEEKPTQARPSNTNPNTQTEDDAVAAAIAAATPALEN